MTGRRLLAALPVLGLALYPLSQALAGNVGVLPLFTADIMRAAGAALALAVALLVLVLAIGRGRPAAAIWLAWALLAFVSYGWLLANGWLPGGRDPEAWTTALAHTLASLALASVVARPWSQRPRDPVPLVILAAAMLAVNLLTAAWALPSRAAAVPAAVAALTARPPSVPRATAARPARDIYYIVLDGFGRPDVLQQFYGADLAPVIAHLRDRGFYVPDRARSNYAQTYLSISSTLNLGYLDGVAAAIGRGSADRRPLGQAIADNALFGLAREAGYDIAVVASDYDATRAFSAVQHCDCEQFGLTDLEEATLAATPLAALPLTHWTNDAHRRKVLSAFAALERPVAAPGRTFTFAHLISPHPPFVFYADGRPRTPSRTLLGLGDGDHFPGRPLEYIDGYREQSQFIARRMVQVIDTLLDRPGPKPAIVIHGDHGPGSMLRWEAPGSTNMDERFGIFAAYYLPDDGDAADAGSNAPRVPPDALYATMTPINGARALASRYLGVRLPFVPDRSEFSTWSHPYDLLPIAAERSTSPISGQ